MARNGGSSPEAEDYALGGGYNIDDLEEEALGVDGRREEVIPDGMGYTNLVPGGGAGGGAHGERAGQEGPRGAGREQVSASWPKCHSTNVQ